MTGMIISHLREQRLQQARTMVATTDPHRRGGAVVVVNLEGKPVDNVGRRDGEPGGLGRKHHGASGGTVLHQVVIVRQ